jgi:hypothetical protein
MIREINRTKAIGRAWRLTQDYCLDKPEPVPVDDIAMDHGVLCIEAKLTGCLARLVRKGNRGIIRTKDGIRESGRRRFAIAHELGHWFLHEAENQVFICTGEDMRDYKRSPMEVEANLFASELLLPTPIFRPLAEAADPRLETVKQLSGLFETSLTATGMRFVDENKHECILVLSTDGAVTWSKQKGKRSGLRIEKGMRLHQESLACHVPTSGDCGPEVVTTEAWIAQNAFERTLEITEQSWYLRDYKSVLSLLVVVDADGHDDFDMVSHYQRKNQGRGN